MEPLIKNNSVLVISFFPYLFREPKTGDIIAFKKNKMTFIKRIEKINGQNYFVSGDNKTDSLEIGWIQKEHILGKLIHTI